MRRDVSGLMLLFIMPAILIIVMALVQDAPFKDYQELQFELLLADNDNGTLANEIKNGLKQSKNFHVIDSLNGQPVSETALKDALQNGDYRIGIVIPKGATAEVVNAANLVANNIAGKMGMSIIPTREIRDTTYVRVYFDPVSKPTFRTSISFALDKYVTYSCSNILVQRLSKMGKMEGDTTQAADFKRIFQGIGIREEQLGKANKKEHVINSVQHNVPAWAIFGMFFIVIPIAGHMIRERDERSTMRIELIPRAYRFVAMGKIIFYTLICTLQFICMFCIGIWLMPVLGLPALSLGTHPFSILLAGICIAYTATAYGYFVGAMFKTSNQAMPFGAISVVILSAIGGVWVPADILSPMMQQLSFISPLRWGLDAINTIMLRNGSITDVLLHMTVLLALGTLLWLISIYKNARRYSNQ